MKTIFSFLISTVMGFVLLPAANGDVRTFELDGDPYLILENVSGNITLRPGADGMAVVNYTKEDDRVEVHFDQSGGRLEIRVEYPRGGGNFRGGISFDIQFPAEAKLNVKSVSGNITSEGISGELELNSVSGTIEVSNASGSFDLNSVSGDVDMTGLGEAEVDANSISGDVKYSRGSLSGGDYNFNSTSGNVTIRHGADASFHISGQSVSGNIRSGSNGLAVKTAKYTHMKSLGGSYNGNGVSVSVNTVSGNISVDVD